jgi:hypothetical protein
MKLYTTLNLLRKHEACAPGYRKVRSAVGLDFDEDEPIDLLTVLDSNGFSDAVWTLRATTDVRAAMVVCVEFAQWCADAAAAAADAARYGATASYADSAAYAVDAAAAADYTAADAAYAAASHADSDDAAYADDAATAAAAADAAYAAAADSAAAQARKLKELLT